MSRLFRWRSSITPSAGVLSVAMTPDGQLVTGGKDGLISVWSLKRRKLVGQPLPTDYKVDAVAVTPDGTKVVSTGGGALTVWDLRSREAVLGPIRLPIIIGPDVYPVIRAAVTPDGHAIVVGGMDGRLWILDLATGSPLRSPIQAHGLIFDVAVTPPGPPVRRADSRRRSSGDLGGHDPRREEGRYRGPGLRRPCLEPRRSLSAGEDDLDPDAVPESPGRHPRRQPGSSPPRRTAA